MRKAACYSLLALLIAGVIVVVVYSSLYAVDPPECWCHIEIAEICGNFCEVRGRFCAGYFLISAVCYGDECNQTWMIQCDKYYETKAGGAPTCWSCIDDGGMDHDGGDTGGGTN